MSAAALGRLSVTWHGLLDPAPGPRCAARRRRAAAGGAARRVAARARDPAGAPRRLPAADLDLLGGAGEVVWVGVGPLGERDGRVALYLTDHAGAAASAGAGRRRSRRARPRDRRAPSARGRVVLPGDPRGVRRRLSGRDGRRAVGSRVARASSPTTRSTRCGRSRSPRRASDTATPARAFRSRRLTPPAAEGRWALVDLARRPAAERDRVGRGRRAAAASRHGVLTREAVAVENLPGGFSAVYDVLKAMEEAGRIRRGYFVGGLGATQFARAGAVDLLRSVREEPGSPQTVYLAATDPANPYGAILKWPRRRRGRTGARRDEAAAPTRSDASVGAGVILVNGALAAYVGPGRPAVPLVPARGRAGAQRGRRRGCGARCSRSPRPSAIAGAC